MAQTTMSNPASPRAQRAASVIRDAYGGMHEWQVWIYEADAPGENDEADGHIITESRYRKAHITIRRGLTVEREREVLAHELAHALLSPIDVAVERITELLRPRYHAHAGELYTDALEPLCERLSRAVLALIPSSTWASNQGT